MRVNLITENGQTHVSPFVGRFTANICQGIVRSLKAPEARTSILIRLEGERIELRVDGESIELSRSQGFAGVMVRDTVRGMIQNLKNVDPAGDITIEVYMEGDHA